MDVFNANNYSSLISPSRGLNESPPAQQLPKLSKFFPSQISPQRIISSTQNALSSDDSPSKKTVKTQLTISQLQNQAAASNTRPDLAKLRLVAPFIENHLQIRDQMQDLEKINAVKKQNIQLKREIYLKRFADFQESTQNPSNFMINIPQKKIKSPFRMVNLRQFNYE